MVVRPARTDDPHEVRRLYDVCLRTGADGEDATARYRAPRLLGEIYLGAYLALEPDLAFVLDDDGAGDDGAGDGPLGYVVGARDTAAFEARCEREWWPALRERHPRDAFPAGSPDDLLVRMIHAPGTTSAPWLDDYPAHLHVDLLPAAQGGGNGRRLLETLFDALRADGVPGLHLGVSEANVRAIGFYEHLGLRRLPTPEGLVLGLPLR
ncbi:N-acetyltransferase [Cellulomonas sp. PhB143]|uniref:GNAT family N-acetyltransferase n=1 Tax=Cellulomonas sp. PhB143 TaxID=2485186 RepID=UPI000F480ED7|nr:GNAT family N-acetyltransferase [Cellulomonas sp. PhB143]ROS78928.1 acetyltransferase (GNAT) family protein [Cellulomonas sp. PhB143]